MTESCISNEPSLSIYKPLRKETNEIRLIEILPSEDADAKVEVRLFQRPLKDVSGQFMPFSYVWGDSTDTKPIKQTRTLLPDILAKGFWDKPTIFWADAICINQQDPEERNHQVQLMKSIYSSTPMALAWLGNVKDSHLALASHQATDPRDRVYGLLDVTETSLEADYTKGTAQVYREFVSAWIDEVKDLNFLLSAQQDYRIARHGPNSLPSWAPDWEAISHKEGDTKNYSNMGFFVDSLFDPHDASEQLSARNAHLCDDLSTLVAPGVVAGKIEEVYPCWLSDTSDTDFALDVFQLAIKYFSKVWKEDIFKGYSAEYDTMDWEDAAAAMEWTWENAREDIEFLRVFTRKYLESRVKFVTNNGYLGIVTAAQVGGDESHYEHVGPCFVVGLMQGETKQMVDRGEVKIETFEIR
ncbi:hypothetical protein N0V84_006955 [Fusarium piperis]|uniref:Heterokaryon incompatibility domain-containing protein n=1 Tax=Fusarium piperis TaxID=1435070 RepID=A0A9W9BP37_9HYPO|nr:hypothetical protein N0V84_006955 [Fusarium piperis]